MRIMFVCAVTAAAIIGAAPASGGPADGDPEAGRAPFLKNCGGCHGLSADNNYYGPNLHCVIGRAAGSAPYAGYSETMKAAAASGLVWDPDSIDRYLTDPSEFIADHLGKPDAAVLMQTKVADAAERRNLIAYIGSRCR